MTCETGQVCASGKCIVERVDYDSIACTTNIGCSGTHECSVGYCKDIVCEEGYYPKEHKCFCEGVHCTAKLTEENNFVDENLSTEETASFDWFSLLFWLFILLLFLLIIGILIWFFIIKKKKKEGIPTESKQSFF